MKNKKGFFIKNHKGQFFRMKNRKGFLLGEETLKIILAVIAIGFLVYLLFSIYNAHKDAEKLELAKESLDFLMQEMNAGRTRIQIYNPEGWIICSWPNLYSEWFFKEGMPKSCSNLGWSSCICICKKNTPNECDSKGVCLNNPRGGSGGEGIEIKDPPVTLLIDYENRIITRE